MTTNQPMTVPALLKRYEGQIAAALPKHLTPDRMARLALTAVNSSPMLKQADPISLMGAIIRCSQDGLEPGRTAHLVPFRNNRRGIVEVQYIADYRGLMELARRSGHIGAIYADVVKKGDYFEYERGTDDFLRHRPAPERGVITHVYAVAHARDKSWSQFEVMTVESVNAIRNRSRAGKDGPWVTDYEAMACKTVLRRLCKYLPSSPELMSAIASDELAELGQQNNAALIDADYWTDTDDELAEAIVEDKGVSGTKERIQKKKKAAKREESKPEPEEAPAPGGPPSVDEVQAKIEAIATNEDCDEALALVSDLDLPDDTKQALKDEIWGRAKELQEATT